MRRVRPGLFAAALCAALAAAPAAAQSDCDVPPALRPLPAELRPQVVEIPSVELTALSRRPVWLLPVAGLVAGAIVYPMLVEPSCDDCTIYIPEPFVGGMIGLMGGIGLEVTLLLLEGKLDHGPAVSLRSASTVVH